MMAYTDKYWKLLIPLMKNVYGYSVYACAENSRFICEWK